MALKVVPPVGFEPTVKLLIRQSPYPEGIRGISKYYLGGEHKQSILVVLESRIMILRSSSIQISCPSTLIVDPGSRLAIILVSLAL